MEKNHCKLANWDVTHLANAPHRAVENAAQKYSGSGGIRAGEGDAAAAAGDDADAENNLELLNAHPRARSYRGDIAR
jgi:hypothetical protein